LPGDRLLTWILDRAIEGIPPLATAEALAAEYAADRRYRTTAERVAALTRWEATKNFATGFTTGLGGFATLPFNLPAALGASWALQARLAGAIAVLYGHSLKDDRVRTLMLLAVAGDSAKDVVKAAGIVVGRRLTQNAIRTVPGRVLIQLNRLVGMRLLTKAGSRGVVNLVKAVPVAGGLVGGGIDAATCVAVGRVADQLFAPGSSRSSARRRNAGAGAKKKPATTAARGRATTKKRKVQQQQRPRIKTPKGRGAGKRRRREDR
jgi:uncharacterized protein (DUF697 family)